MRRSRRTLAEKFAPYDTADYLQTTEDMGHYVEAALDEAADAPALSPRRSGPSRSQNFSELARTVGMSRQGLDKALSEDGNPSYATIVKVTKDLGLKIEFHAAD